MKHDGWTWGSVGAVYAETPDRIWIAQRGELPLPPNAKPWTPYSMLNPSRGNATGNTDGLSATCEPTPKHVWIIDDEQHLIWKFTYNGTLVMTLGTVGKRGRDAGKLFDRPTDIDRT